MIELSNVSKRYRTRAGEITVLQGIDFSIGHGQKIGILGSNGAGKSTLIRLLSGVENPSSGTVTRSMSTSWPLAFSGGFQGSLTGAQWTHLATSVAVWVIAPLAVGIWCLTRAEVK